MKKVMRWIGCGAAALAAAALALAGGLYVASERALHRRYEAPPFEFPTDRKPDPARGRRLVTVRYMCVECHGADLGGKTVIDDKAMGLVSGPNVTPKTLAGWTDAEIARALRHGIGRDGRPLVLMPSEDFINLSADDVADVVAALRAAPPVERATIPVKPGPIMRMLIATGKTEGMLAAAQIDHRTPPPPAVKEAPTKEFGAYLAHAICMGCHGKDLKGGPIPGGDPKWPPAANITPDALDGWSYDDFARALREGVNPSKSKIRYPMQIAYTSKYDDTELKALWAFLVSLPKSKEW